MELSPHWLQVWGPRIARNPDSASSGNTIVLGTGTVIHYVTDFGPPLWPYLYRSPVTMSSTLAHSWVLDEVASYATDTGFLYSTLHTHGFGHVAGMLCLISPDVRRETCQPQGNKKEKDVRHLSELLLLSVSFLSTFFYPFIVTSWPVSFSLLYNAYLLSIFFYLLFFVDYLNVDK